MKKLSFVILLLLPLITFGQAQKRYKSVIIDSLKARTGGIIDVKDTLKHDIGIKFNDGTFQSTAATSGNTIYSGDADLTGDRTVTMAGNDLTFTGSSGDRFRVAAEVEYFNIPGGFPASGNTMMFQLSNVGIIKGSTGAGAQLSIRNGDNTRVMIVFSQDAVTIKNAPLVFNTASLPALSSTTGSIFGSDVLILKCGSTGLRMRPADNSVEYVKLNNSTGNFDIGLGGTGGTARLTVGGINAAPTSDALLIQDNVGTDLMVVENGGNVGIGTVTPAASAILDISTTLGAVLFPRLTTTQRNALTPVDGMVIYNSSTNELQVRAAANWVPLH